MAPKHFPKEGPKEGTTVTVPIATFFKYVKVNGFEGTVTFNAGPHIAMARTALNARPPASNDKEEAAALKLEVEQLKMALANVPQAGSSKSKKDEEGKGASATEPSDESYLDEDGQPVRKKSKKAPE
uniref:Uncharacterized protein n=1 Tax=Acrobeloides nanus TaxID=290746 RepID=A0A914DKV9_9BILA